MVDVEDQGKVERVGAGGQGFGQDAVAPDVLEGDAALVPAEVVGEVAGGGQWVSLPAELDLTRRDGLAERTVPPP